LGLQLPRRRRCSRGSAATPAAPPPLPRLGRYSRTLRVPLPRLRRHSRGSAASPAALNSTRLASTASRCLLTTFCLIAAWQAISLSLATYFFRQGTVDSVSAALRLVPKDSTYLVDLAVRQPQNAVPLLKRAAVANPHDAAPWIQLGLIAEMRRRDPAQAEHDYLHAAKINRTSLTRWTLANFYFRQHRIAEAFHWSQATLQITASDATPIFLQLWSGADDPARIAAIIPDRPWILYQYLAFLLRSNRLDAIEPIAMRAMNQPYAPPKRPGTREILGTTEDKLLASGRTDAALKIWAGLHEKGMVGSPAPSAQSPVTNERFSTPSFGHGFDWTFSRNQGVEIVQVPEIAQLLVRVTGQQPERCRLIQQLIVLDPGRRYRLTWTFTSEGIPEDSGLHWRILNTNGSPAGSNLVGPDLFSANRSPASWDFQPPPNTRLCLLALDYSRPFGTIRAEGSITLH